MFSVSSRRAPEFVPVLPHVSHHCRRYGTRNGCTASKQATTLRRGFFVAALTVLRPATPLPSLPSLPSLASLQGPSLVLSPASCLTGAFLGHGCWPRPLRAGQGREKEKEKEKERKGALLKLPFPLLKLLFPLCALFSVLAAGPRAARSSAASPARRSRTWSRRCAPRAMPRARRRASHPKQKARLRPWALWARVVGAPGRRRLLAPARARACALRVPGLQAHHAQQTPTDWSRA